MSKKSRLTKFALSGFIGVIVTLASTTIGAFTGTFDFSNAPDSALSMTFQSGAETLTVTSTAGREVVREQQWSSARTGPIGLYSFFAPMRFAFSIPVTSIEFGFGDAGGDEDSPVVIRAFDSSDNLIGTLTTDYPLNFSSEKTLSGNFPQGAAYFTLASGGPAGHTDTLFWRVVSFTAESTPPPLPAIRISDALPALAVSSGGIVCNPSTIGSRSLSDRKGAIADGVSSLVLRITTTRPVSFTLDNGTVDGTLTACGGGSATNVAPVNGVVAAIYTPPDRFSAPATTLNFGSPDCDGFVPSDPAFAVERRTLGCRPVPVTAVSADSGPKSQSTATLWLNRVPVVLLHGFTSSRAMWEPGGWLDTLKEQGFVATAADYQRVNWNSFASDPTATLRLRAEIESVLKTLKNEQIAAAQVDVIAHSMGGLVARQLSINDGQNKVSLNAHSGWIHRLVTIGTPHMGSAWAALVYPVALITTLKGTIGAWLTSTGVPAGALADMIPGSSALRALQSSTVKTRAIIGIAPAATRSQSNTFFKMISGGLFGTADALFGEANDLIVGQRSQAGGRSFSAGDYVLDVVHTSGGGLLGVAEADSAKVRRFAIDALNAPSSAFQKIVRGEAADPTDDPEWSGTQPPLVAPMSSGVQVRITSPAPGTTVTPGSTLAIRVDATGPLTLSDLVVIVGGVFMADATPAVPSTITVQLPPDLPVGTLTVGVLGMDTSGNLVGDSTTIAASPAVAPTTIAVTPRELNLDAEAATQQLSVLATFGSGASATRAEVSRGATFTTGDAAVAGVTAMGLVTAVGPGKTTIQVSQGGLTVSVPVTVSGAPALATVTGHPSGALVAVGGTASFSASAFGTPAPTVQWQVSVDGGSTFSDISAATTKSYTFTVVLADHGKQFRAAFTNSLGTQYSAAATLSVLGVIGPVVTTPSELRFEATGSGATLQTVTSAQAIAVSFGTGAATAWAAASNQPWLQITGGASATAGTFTAQIVTSSVPVGSTILTATITVTAIGASNSPLLLPVTLTIVPALAAYFTEIAPTVIDSGFTPRFAFPAGTADLNGDGHQDLVMLGADYPFTGATTYSPQPGGVYLGDGDGRFTKAPSALFPVDTLKTVHPRKVLFADFNGDGRSDMFVSSHGWDATPFPGEQNRLYLSTTGGGWRDATNTLPQLADFSHSSAAGDMSGRGIVDIFVGNGYEGQNRIPPYSLINNGSGAFTLTRGNVPVGSGESLDPLSLHHFPGVTLTDLDDDGLPELIATADCSEPFNTFRRTTIFWNRQGRFLESDKTELPAPKTFGGTHIDLDVQAIDVNGDRRRDLVVVGTQGKPFYDGWFVQILMNKGNHQFVDETAIRLPADGISGGTDGQVTKTPWAQWVKVLDYNRDGAPDFAVEYIGQLQQSQPLIWLNDRAGRFWNLKVRDFVAPGNEWRLGTGQLVATRNGYSFITPQYYTGSGGLIITGLAATRPYEPLSMSVDRPTLTFGATNDGTTLSNITAEQSVAVTFLNGSTAWTATTTTPWLQVRGGSGTGTSQFSVAVVNASGLPLSGTVTGTVTVTSSGAANRSVTMVVDLKLFPGTVASVAPFGAFDTPAAGANVSGSIAVTGWALDDIQVSRVEIWRDRVAGETTPVFSGGLGNGKIFIANAFFIDGARADVEGLYPALPFAYRAGWGYLLLTQGLWAQGNGSYTLYAFAYDVDGHGTVLGSKTITSNNATAVKPFGSIDTPTYGQTVTTNLWNFGWALTPNATPTCVITDGNVKVSIDSQPLVPVTYGGARTDIASAFPGFSNGSAAGGAYFIDISKLSNGTHLIGWFVVDSCNRSEGIGSRFFTVLNGGTTALRSDRAFSEAQAAVAPRTSSTSIELVRGTDATIVHPSATGARVVSIRQGERVEVRLPSRGGAYSGYQLVNGQRRALPLGSTFDATEGILYWEPGPGFLGAHDLEFASTAGDEVLRVRAVIGTAVQSVIDTPRPGPVESSFLVAGWAVDEASTEGTGIDAVHVWAYPVAGGTPAFLGVASYGDQRPDVGALFGDRFQGSSYTLPVQSLAAGDYDIVVYPHSSAIGDFHGAKVVRVTVR